MLFISQNVLFELLNKKSPALLSRFLNAPAQLMEEFRNLFANRGAFTALNLLFAG